MGRATGEKTFDRLCKRLGYEFKDRELLEQAFRHSSYVNETGSEGLEDNERLEFLGDAVLDLAIGHILMDLFEDATEGELTKVRSFVVNERGLCNMARALDLGEYLFLGRGEEASNGREKPSILADTMEALLGALYLDGGFEKTKEIIRELFVPVIREIQSETAVSDYKSLIQEYTQEVYKTRPEYRLVQEKGPAHEKTFKVALKMNGQVLAEAEGRSKKEAEQKAAKEAFLCLRAKGEDP
ncbi:MAG: ribonuclease III [Deltaproteobacteria bacterium]|nr:ribonuclease III [Deltaproteobacteria bacterium]MBW2137133.1 ribonuclease III [Deltaproteobacteria bacterium]